MITIFVKPNCPQCTKVKAHLSSAKIPYQSKMIDEDIANTARENGISSAPVILQKVGKFKGLYGGYNPHQLEQMILREKDAI